MPDRPPKHKPMYGAGLFDRHGNFVHVQAEVRYPGSEHEPNAQPGGWLLAELILRGCALGQDPDTCPTFADGRRVLT